MMNSNAIKTFLITSLFFGVVMGGIVELVFSYMLGNPSVFWIVAISTGLAFGICLTLFARSKFVANTTAIQLLEGESIICDGGANHFLGAEGRGGWLYLTNQRLYFKPHDFNIQLETVSIPLPAISKVSARNTFYVVPNGLAVETNTGELQNFVVFNRKNWVAKIAAAVV